MQHKGWFRLEPSDLIGCSPSWHDREPARQLVEKPYRMRIHLERLRIPKQREVIQNRIVFSKGHVVRQSRSRQFDRDVVGKVTILVHHSIVHVGSVLAVVEKQHLTRGLIDFGVRRDSPAGGSMVNPLSLAQRLKCPRVQFINIAALIKGRCCNTTMHDNIGAAGIFEACTRSPPIPK